MGGDRGWMDAIGNGAQTDVDRPWRRPDDHLQERARPLAQAAEARPHFGRWVGWFVAIAAIVGLGFGGWIYWEEQQGWGDDSAAFAAPPPAQVEPPAIKATSADDVDPTAFLAELDRAAKREAARQERAAWLRGRIERREAEQREIVRVREYWRKQWAPDDVRRLQHAERMRRGTAMHNWQARLDELARYNLTDQQLLRQVER